MPVPNDTAIRTTAVVERKQPGLPRYAVVPASEVAPWGLAGTTTVEVEIDGVAVARRAIHRWDDDRWFVSVTDRDCKALGVDTGSTISLTLRVAPTALPEELERLIRGDDAARQAWERLTPSQRRMLREDVGAAKQSGTRARRARKALLGS
jgi:hypothetical protein